MYKMLMFLKKSDDPNVRLHFKEHTLNILSEIAGEKIKPAEVESSLLLEKKYTMFCEISVDSKEKWDKMMTSGEGKKLKKDLMEFHSFIDLIFVNFDEDL